ncbi:MAG: hypothetical protein OEZ37_08050, partial [Gemmatimonadota bacterium]|nr:hypothetical protein [Gemmatimonadota bacterium]
VQRRINGRIVTEEPGTTATARHLGAIGLDFLRGTALSVTGIVLGRTLLPPLARGWPLDGAASAGLLLAGGAVSAGILLRSLGGFRQRRILLVLGIALGIVGARFL